jgi:hypothetical protein
MLFDINLAGEFDGFVMYHQPVASLRPIKPFSLCLPLATGSQMLVEPAHINCELCILDICYSECPSHSQLSALDPLSCAMIVKYGTGVPPVSKGNTFQDLPRLHGTVDNTEHYV